MTTDLDPIEPTAITPNLVAIPLAPTVWDDLPDGQHAVTSNGIVWKRRAGLWHQDPWWQNNDSDGIIAVCANPDEWAYGLDWPRKMVEEEYGPLTPITLPSSYPHDDEVCRQGSVIADGFSEAVRALGALAVAMGLPDTGHGFQEITDEAIRRLRTSPEGGTA